MLSSAGNRFTQALRWMKRDDAGIMDEFITTAGMWIFASVVVIILAGFIWAALSGDIQAMVGVLQNLF